MEIASIPQKPDSKARRINILHPPLYYAGWALERANGSFMVFYDVGGNRVFSKEQIDGGVKDFSHNKKQGIIWMNDEDQPI